MDSGGLTARAGKFSPTKAFEPPASCMPCRRATVAPFEPLAAISTREISARWKRDLASGVAKVFPKSIYENPSELLRDVEKNLRLINSNGIYARCALLVLSHAASSGFMRQNDHLEWKARIKVKPTRMDIHIPSNGEIAQTLSQLPREYQKLYRALLYSGLRLTEIAYICKNHGKLRAQDMGGFTKVELSWNRGTKSAFFAYSPTEVWDELGASKRSTVGLQTHLKANSTPVCKLVPAKYCRKWFAQKCLEVGVKSETVDFYQGRSQRSVLFRHYTNLQVFADADYGKVMARIKEALYGSSSG